MKKKLLYLTRLNPYNLKSWSGLSYFILRALQKNYNVITVGPLSNRVRFFYILKRYLLSIFKIKFDIDRPILVAKDFAKQIEKKIVNIEYDAIITSEPYLVTFLKTTKPIYIYTDFLFSTLYKNYYSGIKVSKSSLIEGNYCESIAIKKSKKIFLTSNYAINHAYKFYNAKKSLFKYLPFGANLNQVPSKKIICKIINNKKLNICNLIVSGVHWERKGIEKAIKVVEEMNNQKVKTKLIVMGLEKKDKIKHYNNVNFIKFLDKNNPNDFYKYQNILKKMHFNILLSKAEAFGLVNIEASAFGLYSITNDVGGIGGAVINNKNGYRFDKDEDPAKIAEYIIKIFRNKKEYLSKSYSSRNLFDKLYDWEKISNKLKNFIK